MEELTIYKFQLEEQKTCMDRMVTQAYKFAENALAGNKDKEARYGQIK